MTLEERIKFQIGNTQIEQIDSFCGMIELCINSIFWKYPQRSHGRHRDSKAGRRLLRKYVKELREARKLKEKFISL